MNNNNTSVLPFYLKEDERQHRLPYAYGQVYPLYAQANMLLPFQIVRPAGSIASLDVSVREFGGGKGVAVTKDMADAGLRVVRFPERGYDVIVYPALLPLPLAQRPGRYEIWLSDGVQTFYSEVFTVVSDVSPYLKVEWWSAENQQLEGGEIVYRNPSFRNYLYLHAELGRPEYSFEEEGETRDGYFFPEKQISEKTYRFNFLAPEYLCDVMRLIRMSDYVRVTDRYGRVYDCDTFLMTPEWQAQGDLASVDVEFQTDTVVKKVGRGYLPAGTGDFNGDYDGDYDGGSGIGPSYRNFSNDFNNDFF